MVWLELLKLVQEKLKAGTKAQVVALGAAKPEMLGLKNEGPGGVLVIRGEERAGHDGMVTYQDVTFYVECCIRSDKPDFEPGYVCLAKLEAEVDEVLALIRQEAGLFGSGHQLMDLVVEQKAGDLDSYRPSLSSIYTIRATVYPAE